MVIVTKNNDSLVITIQKITWLIFIHISGIANYHLLINAIKYLPFTDEYARLKHCNNDSLIKARTTEHKGHIEPITSMGLT